MAAAKAKAAAEAAAIQAVEDYLQSGIVVNAIEQTVERAFEKHFGKFMDRMTELEKANEELKERIENTEGKSLELESSLSAKEAEIKRLNSTIDAQAVSINNLKLAMNEAEQYSRRNCLKFYGVQENESENTDEIVCKLSTEHLGVRVTVDDLDRTHRIAARSGATSDSSTSKTKKPRVIIAKFCSYRVRSAVLRARRNLKGTGMGIDEALTATNQELLWAAKKHPKVKEAWSSDGRVTILLPATNGRTIKKTIRFKDELDKLR